MPSVVWSRLETPSLKEPLGESYGSNEPVLRSQLALTSNFATSGSRKPVARSASFQAEGATDGPRVSDSLVTSVLRLEVVMER